MATSLTYADGRPVRARDIARIKIGASLGPGPGSGPNPWPYDAAAPISPDLAGWLPFLRSADSDINYDRDRLAARARDLVRNDAWAKGAINRMLDAAVGAHFFPIPRPNWRALARQFGPSFDLAWYRDFVSAIRNEWYLWANDPNFQADAAESQTVTQMFRTALRAKLVEGDGLGMMLWQPDAVRNGLARYATRLQIIDPDRMSNPQEMIDTHDRRNGVQINEAGAPVGYHIRRAHQYDWYDSVASITWDFFPRRTAWGRPVVVHDFDKERGGQHRGVGVLTVAMGRFRQLNRYDDASLKAALIRATLGFFLTSPRDENDASDSLSLQSADGADEYFQNLANALYNQQPVMINGARVPVLAPGEKLQVAAGPGSTDDYAAIQDSGHRSIAAATGQATPEVSNDFSKLNYSSYRGALLQASKTLARIRGDFASGFATPVYTAWMEEAIDRNPGLLPRGVRPDQFPELRAGLCGVRWIGPGRGWIDPVKERQGEVLGLDAGFGTLEDTCADIEGEYWEDRIDQRAIEVAAMNERGLKLPNWAAQAPANQADEKPQPI